MADTYNLNYEYFSTDFFQNFLDEKDEAMQSLDCITVNNENIRKKDDKEKYHRINSNVIIVSNVTESDKEVWRKIF